MECCRSSWIGLFALLLAVVDNNVLALEKEYTISLDAGKTTCFYEVLDVNEVFDIEYQVIMIYSVCRQEISNYINN